MVAPAHCGLSVYVDRSPGIERGHVYAHRCCRLGHDLAYRFADACWLGANQLGSAGLCVGFTCGSIRRHGGAQAAYRPHTSVGPCNCCCIRCARNDGEPWGNDAVGGNVP